MLRRIPTECFSLALATDGLGCLCQSLTKAGQRRDREGLIPMLWVAGGPPGNPRLVIGSCL